MPTEAISLGLFMVSRSAIVAAAIGALAISGGAAPGAASAATITFETAPYGDGFTGPVTEAGFTYKTLSGSLFVNGFGNPGQDMEGEYTGGGGILDIQEAGGGDFTFDQLDYAAYSTDGAGSQTLYVHGYENGSLVASDSFTLSNTSNDTDDTYANWTTEAADLLAGKRIDDLQIALSAQVGGDYPLEAIDNVVLTPVPEPAAWALMLAGFLGLGAALRVRRSRAVA
ncbi:MAG: PEP-CTERM sorting domain-containing protein [Caulobacteraceae bacterium]